MKAGGWILLLLLIAGAASAYYYFKVGVSVGPFVGQCYVDGEIEQNQRAALEAVAQRHLIDLRDEAPSVARQSMSAKGQAGTSDAQLAQARSLLRSTQSSFQVVQTFYQQMTVGRAVDGAMAPCESATIALGDTSASGHVLLSSIVPGGALTADVWLTYEPGGWKVRATQISKSAIGRNDGGHVWEMARAQRDQGHALTASILYYVASQLLDRGQFLQTRTFADFQRDAHTFTTAPEVRGAAPYTWRFGEDAFTVSLVNYTSTSDGHIVLDIHQRLPAWPGEVGADARNRALIDAFNIAHPEWKQIADTLAVRTEMPEAGHLFGTTFDRDRGYSDPPLPPGAPPVEVRTEPSPAAP